MVAAVISLELFGRRQFSLGRFPFLTAALCLLMVGIYLWVGQGRAMLSLDVLIEAGAKLHASIFELG
ncbi:MAG: hypothetical protein AAF449_13835, partial [Myxococcota bacterium]